MKAGLFLPIGRWTGAEEKAAGGDAFVAALKVFISERCNGGVWANKFFCQGAD